MASDGPDAAPADSDSVRRTTGRGRLDALSPRQRRRLYVRALVRPALTATLLVSAYFLMPLDNLGQDSPWVLIGIGLALIILVLVWQIRQIMKAQFPLLQAIEALAAVLPLYLLSFAAAYVLMSNSDAANFTQPLSHMGAVYFSVVVFSTVGFGDITPHTDIARAVVTFQILGDLLLIAFGLRLVVAAVKRGQDRLKGGPDDQR